MVPMHYQIEIWKELIFNSFWVCSQTNSKG